MWSINFLVVITTALLVIQVSAEAESTNSSFSTRIVGGKNARQGLLPYQVLIDIVVRKGMFSFCGGSLISPDFVVTAAHCMCYFNLKLSPDGQWVEDRSIYFIVYGVHVSLGITDKNYRGNIQKIFAPKQDIIVHANYNPNGYHNDIALIRLSKPAEFNAYVQPIGLPPLNMGSLIGGKAVASGWGLTSDKLGSISNILQYTSATIIPNDLCNFYRIGNVMSTMLCTQNIFSGSGTCFGDSGGPLVYENTTSGVKYLIGITSWGDKFCENNNPNVFTRVSSYVDWIEYYIHPSMHST